MSKEIELSRRENGLTIRYLAQPIFNDNVFPNQEGIKTLFSKAQNGLGNKSQFSFNSKIEYYFLFHLDDFGSGDKSEIDLLLRIGEVLYMIEIKAFTNPNDTNVKREIIRNYLKLKELSIDDNLKAYKFDKVNEIVPILLYSKPQALKNNRAADFNYFSQEYLVAQGYCHKERITVWDSSSIKLTALKNFYPEGIKEINNKLLFLTWDDVYSSLKELNSGGQFQSVLSEMYNKVDHIQGDTRLISEGLG